MDLHYTNRLIDDKAFVLLNEEINQHNSMMIAEEIYWLKSQGYHVTLKINSIGGSVLAGWNIIDALITTKSDTHIIGLAASMAGVVAQFGAKRYANDNSILMIHPPSGGGDEVLEMVRTSLKKALTVKSKLSEDSINDMMDAGGKDNFFDAGEMEEMGLVDEVIVTGAKVGVVKSTDTENIFQFFNKQIKESTMDNDLKNELKVVNDAKAVLASKVEGLESEKETLTNSLQESNTELEAMKEKVADLENKLEESNKSKAEALINNAVTNGIIAEDKKDDMIEKATNNYELVEELLNQIKPSDFVVENLFNQEGAKNFKDMSEEERADFARNYPEKYNKLILNN